VGGSSSPNRVIVRLTTFNVQAGDRLIIRAHGMRNPTTATSGDLQVSTTADPAAVAQPVTYGGPTSVGDLHVTLTSTALGASPVLYTASFIARSSMRSIVSSPGGGQIVLTAPPGVSYLGHGCDYTVRDVTRGTSANYCQHIGSASASSNQTSSDLRLALVLDVGAGDRIVVEAPIQLPGASQPITGNIGVWTSADPGPQTQPVTFTARPVDDPHVNLSSSLAGASSVTYTVNFRSPGVLFNGESRVILRAPPGTDFSPLPCDYVIEDKTHPGGPNQECAAATVQVSSSDGTSGSPKNVAILSIGPCGGGGSCATPNFDVQSGDRFVVTAHNVTNPSTPGTFDFTIQTSSNPASATQPVTFFGGGST
jgi:hypothetical protein